MQALLYNFCLFYELTEIPVASRPHEQIQNALNGILRLHAVDGAAHDHNRLLFLPFQQQVFSPRSGFYNVERREYPLFGELTVKYKLHITGSLELLVYHVVHLASRID